jgi:SNF2-related domain/Helicase conserved C-terminal domain
MSEALARKPILKKKPSGKFYMHDFQREDIARLGESDSSANWSEMGAMKTTTAEWLWAQKTKHIPNPRVLVITTKTGKGTYYESLAEVLPEWDVYTIGPQKTNLVIGSKPIPVDVKLPDPLYMRPVVVVAHYHCFTNRQCQPQQKKDENGNPVLKEDGTFEMVYPRCTRLMAAHWDAVIVDEAHRIKNQDAQWTGNIKKLKAQYKHIMTGTGFVNNPSEIWSLLNFLYPSVYTSYWRFREHYCEEDDYSGYRKVVGIKPEREDEFKELVRKVGVRRTMIECFPEIKEPIETVVPVDLNPIQQKMYVEMLEYLHTLDQQGEPLHSPNVLSMLNRLRQICVATPEVIADYWDHKEDRRIIRVKLKEPSSKLDATMEIIEGLEWDAERKDQIVVFSNFRDPLELMEARLKKANIPYLRLLPEMNEKTRYELWHDIWTKKEHQVFLSTLAVGSESINLASANRAIFLDQAWSPAMNKQAIGRIYRPGQTGVAQLIYVRAENTVDYRVLGAITEKLGWFKQIFGADEVDDEDEEVTDGS